MRLFERDAQSLDVSSLQTLAFGVANVPVRAVGTLTPPLNCNEGGTLMRFYVTRDTATNRGITAAGTMYKAPRFIRTQAYATHSKFYLLYTSPYTAPLTMSMLQQRAWQQRASSFLRSSDVVKKMFNVNAGPPASLQSRGHAIFTFTTWDETFFMRAVGHLDDLFKQLGLIVEQRTNVRF